MKGFCYRALALAGAAGFGGLMAGCAALRPEPTVAQPLPATVGEVGTRMGPVMPAPSAQWIVQQYTDLPIPKDFRLVPNESFVFIQGTIRKADLNYEGALPVPDLIRFYQESMPTSGWQFLRMTGVRMKTLTYVKGHEVVEIIIESHAPHLEPGDEHEEQPQGVTHLHIQLG